MKTRNILLFFLTFLVVVGVLCINSNSELDKKIQYVQNEITEKVRSIELVQGLIVDMPAFRGALEFQSFGQIDVVVKRLMDEQPLVQEFYILDEKLNVLHSVQASYQDISEPRSILSFWNKADPYLFINDDVYTFRRTTGSDSPAYVMLKLNVGKFFDARMAIEYAIGVVYKRLDKVQQKKKFGIFAFKNGGAWLRHFIYYLQDNFLTYLLLVAIGFIGFTYLMRVLIDPFQRMLYLLQNLSSGELKSVNTSEYPGIYKPFFASIIDANAKIIRAIQKEREMESQKVQFEMAQQVAHDIRSPLSVLKSLRDELSPLSEKTRRIMHLSLNRLEEITLNLLKKNEHIREDFENRSEDLLTLLENVITEKRVEFRNHENVEIDGTFSSASYGLYSQIRPSYLRRMISNIINNSVEACGNKPCTIKVSLSQIEMMNVIEIVDNGPGIAEEYLPHLFEKGFTTKQAGNGLGLSGAKEELDKVGGTLRVESILGEGVTVKIGLRPSFNTSNLAKKIDLYKYQKIIVLDDDFSIHGIWDNKLGSHGLDIEHHYSPDEVFKKYQSLDESILLLSDFEFVNQTSDGIDVINKLRHVDNSILVTARSEERDIRKRCEQLNISFISKSLIPYVEINFKPPMIVLIDDDQLSHWRWEEVREKCNLEFIGFYSIEEFLSRKAEIHANACILLDSDLGNGLKGEIEGEKVLNAGFTRIYLYTSYSDSSFEKPGWIKDVLVKDPLAVLKRI